MQRRSRRLIFLLPLAVLALLCIAAVGYLLYTQPFFSRTPSTGPAITWNALPSPTITRANWTTFSHNGTVNDVLLRDDLLWIGTDGGLVVRHQDTGESVTFRPEHGLIGSRVTAVTVRLDGTIWAGTSGGVSRYDGTQWQTFTIEHGLPAAAVRDVATTADGTVWAATAAGVTHYNGRRWISHNRVNTLFGMPGDNVRALTAVPGQNALWVATDAGLSYFDGTRWQAFTRADGSVPSNDIFAVDATADGVLWVGHGAGLSRYDGSDWDSFVPADGLLAAEVHTVTATANDVVWIGYGAAASGITRLTATGGAANVRHVEHDAADGVRVMAPVANGTLIGGAAGLYLLTSPGQPEAIPLPTTLPTHDFSSMIVARDTVWLGSDAGVLWYDGRSWQHFTRADGLVADQVSALAAGPGETPTAAFATPGMGLSVFRSDGRWQTLACPSAAPPSGHIFATATAPDGRVWLATDGGVAAFDGSAWTIYTTAHGLPGNRVWAIAAAPDGAIWTGTEAGVAVLEDERWRTVAADEVARLAVGPEGTVWALTGEAVGRIENGRFVSLSPLPADAIGTVLAVADGLWMGTVDGLAHFGADGWRMVTTADGLPFNRTPVVAQASDGTLYAVSETGVVESANGYFSPANFNHRYVSAWNGSRWRSRLVADEMRPIHGTVTAVQPAPNGDVWVGTLGGVSRYDGARWQSFTVADGLPSHAVYTLAYAYDSVWVGTEGGVVRLQMAGETAVVSDLLPWQGDAFLRLHLRTAPDGSLWAGDGQHLFRFDGAAWQPVPITFADGEIRLDSMAFDADGRLWAGGTVVSERAAVDGRIYLGRFDGAAWQWQPVQPPDGQALNGLQQLAFAPDGRLWAGSTNGVWVFDPAAATFAQAVAAYRAPVEQVTDLAIRGDGTVLVASRFRRAIFQIDGDGVRELAVPLAGAERTHALALAADGALWVGTDGGAARFDNGEWQPFPQARQRREGVTSALGFGDGGDLWLGTGAGEVLRFRDGRVLTLPRFTDPRSEERSYLINGIFPTGPADAWITSVGGGVARTEAGAWRRLGSSAALHAGEVSSLTVDAAGTGWVGSSNGLFTVSERIGCRQPTDVLWEATTAAAAATDGTLWFVGDGLVFHRENDRFVRDGYQALPVMAVAPNGVVWLATRNGLMRHQGTGQRQLIPFEFEATVTALAAGANGRLWVGTDQGVYGYDGRSWTHLTTRDGLADDRVQQLAVTPDGAVWAATAGGMSRYLP